MEDLMNQVEDCFGAEHTAGTVVEKKEIIKIVGVGGAGCNSVDLMYSNGIKGVNYVVCNTDRQALDRSPVPRKIQLGVKRTGGLGAGCDPNEGRECAIESIKEIEAELNDGTTRMVIIAAGMGGGTGTGAAPVVAEAASKLGLLTVAVLTIPFRYEGKEKLKAAVDGILEMEKYVDSVLVLNTDKLPSLYKNMPLSECLHKADYVMMVAAKGISEIISKDMTVNVDFKDVCTTMTKSGCSVMGVGSGKGENRAMDAVIAALESPLLNNNNIYGARHILATVASDPKQEVSIDENTAIMEYLAEKAGGEENDKYRIIWGAGKDETLTDGEIRVTVIATGFASDCFMTNKNRPTVKIPASGSSMKESDDNAIVLTEDDLNPEKANERAILNERINILYGGSSDVDVTTVYDTTKLAPVTPVALDELTEEVIRNIENTPAYIRRRPVAIG